MASPIDVVREADVARRTAETQVSCTVHIDGVGCSDVRCEIGFLAHMLDAFARHAHVDLEMQIVGDLHVDQHHTVEDSGLVLGQALREALGERRGIWRTGWCRFPMDEALAEAAVDLSGRPCLVFEASFARPKAGDMHTDLVVEFFAAVANALGANIHLSLIRGENTHHCIEALYKAFGRAFELAAAQHPRAAGEVPSTKGSLEP